MADREREEAALDALIVMALRGETEDAEIDRDDLPELSPEDRAAMEALGDDLIPRLIAKAEGRES